MTCFEQLRLWVNGQSVHNADRDECCPDFSCCVPDMKIELIENRMNLALDEINRANAHPASYDESLVGKTAKDLMQ